MNDSNNLRPFTQPHGHDKQTQHSHGQQAIPPHGQQALHPFDHQAISPHGQQALHTHGQHVIHPHGQQAIHPHGQHLTHPHGYGHPFPSPHNQPIPHPLPPQSRMMIGQWGRFDQRKHDRDFRKNFHGVEASQIALESDIHALRLLSEREAFRLGIHFPLRLNQWRLRDPLFMSANEREREESYLYMEREFRYAAGLNPEYILIHYPKPVLLDIRVDWSSWRFADASEFRYDSTCSFDEFSEQSEVFFEWLSGKGFEFGFVPVIELDAVNRYIHGTDFLERMLARFENLRLCLDIGRIHLQDRLDPSFSGPDLVRRFARHAHLIHLWNGRVETNGAGGHHPALPELRTQDGWADVEGYLRLVAQENNHCRILFEHNSSLIDDNQLENCYRWVESLI